MNKDATMAESITNWANDLLSPPLRYGKLECPSVGQAKTLYLLRFASVAVHGLPARQGVKHDGDALDVEKLLHLVVWSTSPPNVACK